MQLWAFWLMSANPSQGGAQKDDGTPRTGCHLIARRASYQA